jgi:RNA polymerase sigma-70 factor, ECF subfamily
MTSTSLNIIATSSETPPSLGSPKEDEERNLVQRAQEGDERAFEQIVKQHQQRVFGLIARILHQRDIVEDIAQQVFLKVYLSLNRFDQRAAFSAWLYRIAKNECWDYLRKKKIRPLLYESELSKEQVLALSRKPSFGRRAARLDDRTETNNMLQSVLEILPERDRQLLLLKEVEGFSVQELADVFGLNVNTLKARLFRARRRVVERRRFLEERSRGGKQSTAQ